MKAHRPLVPTYPVQALIALTYPDHLVLTTVITTALLSLIIPLTAPRLSLTDTRTDGPYAYGFRPNTDEDNDRLRNTINMTVAIAASSLTTVLLLTGTTPWTAVAAGASVATLAIPLTYSACTRVEVTRDHLVVIEVYGTTELAKPVPLDRVEDVHATDHTLKLEGIDEKLTLNDARSLAHDLERIINDRDARPDRGDRA
ncbi:MAG: hypothetical protein GXO28_05750 [Methanopyri archaeon]|nr:hypothetical protein [Methanopyri archaeon]